MRLAYLCVISLALVTNAFAAGSGDYFPPASLPPTLLTPPLLVHSQPWEDEISQMVLMQKTVTAYDQEQITAEIHFGPEVFNTAAPNWDAQHYPATFHLLERADHTCGDVTEQDKSYWNTTRPYLMNPRIKSLAGDMKNGSYPSGHTACSRVMAEVLGQVLPDKLAPLRDRAEEVAQHRILAGVHYPHDIRGGKELALLIMGALEESPAYRQDLLAARNEMKPPG